MAELNIGTTYGDALFQVAREVEKKETIMEEAQAILDVLNNEKQFAQLLDSPAVSVASKKTMFKEVFEGKIEKELLNYCLVMLDKRRFKHFSKSIKAYKEYYDREEGFAYGKVYSVTELSSDKIKLFEEKMTKLFNKNVKLENEIDKKLIGGVKILIDGKILDASLKMRLENLSNNII